MENMSQTVSQYTLCLGGVVLHLESELPLRLEGRLPLFDSSGAGPQVQVQVRVMEEMPSAAWVAEDLLANYYWDGRHRWMAAKSGPREPLTVTEYTPDAGEMCMYVNEREHPGVVRTVNKVLQLLPTRIMLLQRRRLLLHASRVAVRGRAILFTAPSGTGKSTQARLWRETEGGVVLSNDRTLLRELDGGWSSEGYAIDGSDPVDNNTACPLGAIVVLRQGPENRVERLGPAKALKALMEQSVLDVWDREQLRAAQLLWLELLSAVPVYLLCCRPDAEAVRCLKERLTKDGVL